MTGRVRLSRGGFLLLAAVGVGLFAAGVAATGGLDVSVAGLRLRSRSWTRPAGLGLLLAAGGVVLLRHEIRAGIRRLDAAGTAGLAGRILAMLAIGWAGAAPLVFGTYAVGGADSYGYVSQAELLAAGRLTDEVPLQASFTWRDAAATLTPLGFVPAGDGRIAPQYPPGLPLLMAPLAALHRSAVFLLVPAFAAAAVWMCWRLGVALGDPLAGALAALLLSLSPTFLYQAVQPMSDVPVTACWTGALLLAGTGTRTGAVAGGVTASIAILIRPNLAPLLLLVIVAAATGRRPAGRMAAAAGASLPGLAVLGVVQYVRYGSATASGYGPFGDLFSLANVAPNLARYPRWMIETHSWAVLLWLLAPVWIVRRPASVRRRAWLGYALAAGVVLAYLPYVYFQPHEWFYTRFLLPGLPWMLVLGTAPALALLRRFSARWGALLGIGLVLILAGSYVRHTLATGILDLRISERRYPAVGRFVRDRLPPATIVLAKQHSGSVRYYAARPTVRWDLMDPRELGRAVADLRRAGYTPVAVLDPDEEQEFRARFGAAAIEGLSLLAIVERTRIFELDAGP